MQLSLTKYPGGVFVAHSEMDLDSLQGLKTGEPYMVDLKNVRHPDFHRKVFQFFKFCFDHWKSDREFMNEKGQFDVFRKNLTVLAGYYDEFYNLKGEVRIEPKSLAFGNMEQEEFEQVYQSLIAVAVRKIFPGCDKATEQRLYSFF